MENKVPPYKETECKGCKTKDKPLFLMPKPRDSKDFYCKECRVKELEKRAKE